MSPPPTAVPTSSKAAELYLNLLKRVLTRYAFGESYRAIRPRPGTAKAAAMNAVAAGLRPLKLELVKREEFNAEARRLGMDIPADAETMIGITRLDNLQFCIEDIIANHVAGDLIETGVWRGGAVIFMQAVLTVHEETARSVWVADSFQGLPPPDLGRYPQDRDSDLHTYGHLQISLEEVRRNFERYQLLADNVHFLKGWFKDTLPTAPVQRLAIMRLDGDYYESTRDALRNLYHRLSPGGYAIIDDYAEDTWTYCRKAVDEFRTEHHIRDPLIRVDDKCYYWQRS